MFPKVPTTKFNPRAHLEAPNRGHLAKNRVSILKPGCVQRPVNNYDLFASESDDLWDDLDRSSHALCFIVEPPE
jgi:hypothetical protein